MHTREYLRELHTEISYAKGELAQPRFKWDVSRGRDRDLVMGTVRVLAQASRDDFQKWQDDGAAIDRFPADTSSAIISPISRAFNTRLLNPSLSQEDFASIIENISCTVSSVETCLHIAGARELHGVSRWDFRELRIAPATRDDYEEMDYISHAVFGSTAWDKKKFEQLLATNKIESSSSAGNHGVTLLNREGNLVGHMLYDVVLQERKGIPPHVKITDFTFEGVNSRPIKLIEYALEQVHAATECQRLEVSRRIKDLVERCRKS